MNKKEAAKFLGVSEKTIERAVKANQIAATYVKGKYGKKPIFDRAELQRFKEEREAILHAPIIETDTQEGALIPFENQLATTNDTSDKGDALGFANVIKDAITDAFSKQVQIKDKILLTAKECSQLTGINEDEICSLARQGKLKGYQKTKGGTWRITRANLDEFIKNL